jgi:lysophospholipase L1-like esterase
VIIALGTNDLKPGNLKHITEFVEDYVLMIESFRKFETRPDVWICYPASAYPVNWRVTGSVIAEGVMLLIDKIAGQSDANIIDLYGALSNRTEFFADTVHPNTNGAKLIAETIKAVITAGKTPSLSPHKHTQH